MYETVRRLGVTNSTVVTAEHVREATEMLGRTLRGETV